jgi:hypothetical protein
MALNSGPLESQTSVYVPARIKKPLTHVAPTSTKHTNDRAVAKLSQRRSRITSYYADRQVSIACRAVLAASRLGCGDKVQDTHMRRGTNSCAALVRGTIACAVEP